MHQHLFINLCGGVILKKFSLRTVSITVLIILLALVFILKHTPIITNSTNVNKNFTIIIDAGHGGEDGGAVAPDGSFEKDYNLDIALRLKEVLTYYGYNVIMTRTTDTMTCDTGLITQREKKISDIRNRLKLINSTDNCIFVSIHQNNFSDSHQEGAQVFYSKNNVQSRYLADEIQKSIVSTLQTNNKRKTKLSGTEIFLLYHSTVPSVLVECGFLSNNNDLINLKNNNYKTKLAIVIADGIINFLN